MTSVTIHLTPVVSSTFATVTDVEEFLQVEISADATKNAACVRALEAATAAIRNYCHQYLSEVEDEEITLDSKGGTKVFLPELPVTDVAEVVEDGETLVEGADDDYQVGDHGVLHRVSGNWVAGIGILEVTYTHGYDVIPDDIVDVCTRAAARAYQAGLQSAATGGVPGVSNLQLGDFAAGFQSSVGGGVSEPAGVASTARMLLLSEKDILDKYRYVAQPTRA